MSGNSLIMQFLKGNMPFASRMYDHGTDDATASKNTAVYGTPDVMSSSERFGHAMKMALTGSPGAALHYLGATAQQDAEIQLGGYEYYLLNHKGFTYGTRWAETMNVSNERDLSGVDLIRDEFGPNAAKDFGELPDAAKRMMIMQAQLNKSDRINKAMTDKIQKLHSMLREIINNFKG